MLKDTRLQAVRVSDPWRMRNKSQDFLECAALRGSPNLKETRTARDSLGLQVPFYHIHSGTSDYKEQFSLYTGRNSDPNNHTKKTVIHRTLYGVFRKIFVTIIKGPKWHSCTQQTLKSVHTRSNSFYEAASQNKALECLLSKANFTMSTSQSKIR